MSFGTTIKKLRRNKDMTQEELAEVLSISPQAVSRWETDAAMPDISLFPSLCNFFGVTSDYLLGIDVANRQQQIEKIIAEAEKLSFRGYLCEAREILENGLKKYPDDYRILRSMMLNSFNQFCIETDEAKKKIYSKETINLGEKILDGCTTDQIRMNAVQILCLTYPECGMRDKARELAVAMPFIYQSRECLLSIIETGEEKRKALMAEGFNLIQQLERNIVTISTHDNNGEMLYSCKERIALMDKVIAMIKLFFENGDYGYFNSSLQTAHILQSQNFSEISDSEKTLYHLSEAVEYTIGFLEFFNSTDFVHTSLMLRGNEGGSFGTNSSDNFAQLTLNELKNKRYDFLRSESQFAKIEEKLKIHAGKWQLNVVSD